MRTGSWCAVVIAWAVVGAAHAASFPAGLWEAKSRFGPDVRGEVLVRPAGAGWEAEVAGHRVPAKVGDGRVSFELPDGLGGFEGPIERSNQVEGFWIQQRTVTSGARYATPLRLSRDAAGNWRGVIVPLDDAFTFYLVVKEGAEGSAPAFLRNPERNLGLLQYRAEGIEIDAGKASLLAAGKDGQKGRVLASGKYDEARKALSIDFASRGGSYDFHLLAPGASSHFYPRGTPSATYTYAPPPQLDDGWQVAPVEDVGISRAAIERLIRAVIQAPMDSAEAPEDHAILIARRGKLVVEEYFHGEGRDKPHDSRSASKSVAADMVGAAIQAGLPISTFDPVYRVMNGGRLPPGLEPRRRAMKLEHLLTMSSGFDCDDNDEKTPGYEDNMWEQEAQPDFFEWALALPMSHEPGEYPVYCSANANLAGGMVARAGGESVQAMFKKLLGDPLQMRRYFLPLSPAGELTLTGGLRFLPRDFMKLGQVHLNGGTWNGRRIYSREWSERAVAPLVYLPPYEKHYGYLWWVHDYPYKGRALRAFHAGGNGGQVVMVIPELELVMTFHGGSYNHVHGRRGERVYVPEYILPAIVD